MFVYKNCKINGPYTRKDGRQHVIVRYYNPYRKKTISYPKYLLEVFLDRYLEEDEVVHHKDEDPLNNNINNLEVMNRSLHTSMHQIDKKVQAEVVSCVYCDRIFILRARQVIDRRRNSKKGKNGPFCSKKCSGLYGKDIQNKRVLMA